MRSAWLSRFTGVGGAAGGTPKGSRSVRVGRRNLGRRLHLGHQVVVPLAFHLEMGGGAELDGLDQVMRDIGVDAGLQELVGRSTRGAAADEPGLQPRLRRIGEFSCLPDIVAMAADQVWAAVAVGL